MKWCWFGCCAGARKMAVEGGGRGSGWWGGGELQRADVLA